MSTELATVFEERGKPLKSEPELGSGSGSGSGIRVKKWVKLGTESREPEQKSEPPKEMDLSKYDNSPRPYIYMHGDFVYKNEAWKKSEAEMEDYKKRRRGLSPYDAIAPPPRRSNPILALGGVIRPLPINDKNRPTLIALSQLALTDYNQRIQAPTFVFHRLVKCCFARSQLSGYYITFEAKAKEEEEEDPSNSPAITTFQAQVWESENAPHEVIECKIKI